MRVVQMLSAAVVLGWVTGATSYARAETKVINITGTGGDAQYIEDGKTKQLSVRIRVGDSIKWVNPRGNQNHTATSDVKDAGQRHLFDEQLNADSNKTVLFDQAMYDRAKGIIGTVPGDDNLYIGYYCKVHKNVMGGKIVLQPANATGKEREDEKHE